MFTTVNSNKKIDKYTLEKDSCLSSELEGINLNEKRFSISKKLKIFFSFSDDFFSLQLAIFCLTFFLSIFASVVSCLIIDLTFGFSLFIGSIAGIFYLRLLAKSIGNLGKTSSGVSKVQLLLPICLFIFASKSELIEILPSIIGFFLYKPAILFYFSRS
mgnify:CR=1 FL=1|tara:strand:- start:959 stop:1435 length:477 start_codon:yes stop_codon:yes gene_type:complete